MNKEYRGKTEMILKNKDKRLQKGKAKKEISAPTGCELRFIYILLLLNLKRNKDFIFQYEFHRKVYDFYLVKQKVLIEVDGDFWHVNPETHECKYPIQEQNVKNDAYKTALAKKHKVKLLRFWEKDINEKPEWIISEVKKILK